MIHEKRFALGSRALGIVDTRMHSTSIRLITADIKVHFARSRNSENIDVHNVYQEKLLIKTTLSILILSGNNIVYR